MSQIHDQVEAVKAAWRSAYEKANAAPASWQPHWPHGSLVVIDEVVDLFGHWVDRVRAPAGFSPGFQLAQVLGSASLPALLSTAQQLEAGNFNFLPTFVNQLVGALSVVHTMAVYSNKDESLRVVGDLQAQLAEGLAVLGTAQHEFAEKASTIQVIDAMAEKIDGHLKVAEATATESETLRDEISKAHEDALAASQRAAAIAADLVTSKESLLSLTSAAQTTKGQMDDQAAELQSLLDAAKAQSTVIESILPKAASAGLAAAFSTRGSQLNGTKKLWAGAFIGSLLLLAALAFYLFNQATSHGEEFWQHLALRLTLAAPLVWLGWFSAVQYGNIVRVQEDYAFKEATSKAFQGYRDHMQHLTTINTPDAGTALNLLAVKTIEILAHEPLRIYGRTDKDASPAHSILDTLTKRSGAKEPPAA